MVDATSAAFCTGASGTKKAPSRNSSLRSAATCIASRVFPLPPAPDGGDPGRSMDVDPDVAVLRQQRFTGVQAHPDADRPLPQRCLPIACRCQRIGSTPEGDEECVALRVDLDATVPLKRRAE